MTVRNRAFECWVDCGHRSPTLHRVEIDPTGRSEGHIELELDEIVQGMLANIDAGWRELGDPTCTAEYPCAICAGGGGDCRGES